MQATIMGSAELPDFRALLAEQELELRQEAAQLLADAFVAAAQAASPLANTAGEHRRGAQHRVPGELRQSIAARVEGGSVLVTAGAPYALYVLCGVRPQYMTWLLGKTVAFTARDGQRIIRRVRFVGERDGRRHWWHPGMPARDFFRQAWESREVTAVVDAYGRAGLPVAIAYLYAPTVRG